MRDRNLSAQCVPEQDSLRYRESNIFGKYLVETPANEELAALTSLTVSRKCAQKKYDRTLRVKFKDLTATS